MFEFCGHKHNIMQVAFLCIRFIFGFKITCTINWYMRIFIIIIIVIFTLSLKFRIQVCKEIVKYRIHDWIKYRNYFFFLLVSLYIQLELHYFVIIFFFMTRQKTLIDWVRDSACTWINAILAMFTILRVNSCSFNMTYNSSSLYFILV